MLTIIKNVILQWSVQHTNTTVVQWLDGKKEFDNMTSGRNVTEHGVSGRTESLSWEILAAAKQWLLSLSYFDIREHEAACRTYRTYATVEEGVEKSLEGSAGKFEYV